MEEEVVAETSDDLGVSEDEEVTGEHATAESDDEAPSITELLIQLGRDVTALAFREAQLAASRNPREVRRAIRDIAAALIAALAFVTAFAFANVAALTALRTVMSRWLAALLLCAAWLALGSVLALGLSVRAGRVTGWRWWRVGRGGHQDGLARLERARDEAEEAVRGTLGKLTPAMTVEIASAVAPDSVGDVVDVGGDLLEASDDIVEDLVEDLPAGSVVAGMWDVVLMPGRIGVKVATTVLRRGDSRE